MNMIIQMIHKLKILIILLTKTKIKNGFLKQYTNLIITLIIYKTKPLKVKKIV